MSAIDVMFSQQSQSRQLHKFGGSSLADANCFRRVAGIIEQYTGTDDLLVVSAAGKTTNSLIEWLYLLDKNKDKANVCLQNLRHYQCSLIETLLKSEQRQQLIDALLNDIDLLHTVMQKNKPINEADSAWVQGFGEVWSARLLCAFLNQQKMPAIKCDSRDFLRAQRSALPEVDLDASAPLLLTCLQKTMGHRIVITGFMAQNDKDETVLLGRNGSDYSATVIGALANVSQVTIWSDVAGVYNADPQIVTKASLLSQLCLDEAAELARLGAPVLHARTLQPLAKSNLDLHLRCSYEPNAGCTRIERIKVLDRGVKIITSLADVCLISIDISDKQNEMAICQQQVQAFLDKYQLQPLVYSSDISDKILLAYPAEIASDIFHQLQDKWQECSVITSICLVEGYSMLAVVGAGVASNHRDCYHFYQQLKAFPIQFSGPSPNGLSLVAILPKTNTDKLVAHVHQAFFPCSENKKSHVLNDDINLANFAQS